MAIPFGKKCLCWFSYFKDEDVCYFMDLNKDKKVSNAIKLEHDDLELSLNTVLYATVYQEENSPNKYIIVENIYYFCGLHLKNYTVNEKWRLLENVLMRTQTMFAKYGYYITLPHIWTHQNDGYDGTIPKQIEQYIPYNIHHVQYRNSKLNITYLNMKTQKLNMLKQAKKGTISSNTPIVPSYECTYDKNMRSDQYGVSTVFVMKADVQSDIYHLFAFGKNGEKDYYDSAYIPNYEVSVKMNSHFRNIKENGNIDCIEESDDEDDFQNTDAYKHVDLKKEMKMSCTFDRKFKKWIPIQTAPADARVVHMNTLVYGYLRNNGRRVR
jgi:hypothetical protein